MKTLNYTTQFKRDIKRLTKRGVNLDRLKVAVDFLVNGKTLPRDFKDHPLKGSWRPARDCHLSDNLVLIYHADDARILFQRIGTHSDVFGW